MADPVVLSNGGVYVGGYDISGELNKINLAIKRAENPDARLGDDISAVYPGIIQPDLSVSGFTTFLESDATIAGPRIILATSAAAWPVTVAPPYAPAAAPGAYGNIAYCLRGCQTAFKVGGQHGESLQYDLKTVSRSANGIVDRLTIMAAKATVVATTTGTGKQLGALTAAQKMVAVLHVFAVNGGTWTLTIESDDNSGFTTPAVRATFTGATAITNQAIEIAGAITDDWWRCVYTKVGGTSSQFAALLGIANL